MHELIEDELADLFARPITGIRIRNILLNDSIATMSQLLAKTRGGLRRCPNLGAKSLAALEQALAERGLYLADVSPPELREPHWWRALLNELT